MSLMLPKKLLKNTANSLLLNKKFNFFLSILFIHFELKKQKLRVLRSEKLYWKKKSAQKANFAPSWIPFGTVLWVAITDVLICGVISWNALLGGVTTWCVLFWGINWALLLGGVITWCILFWGINWDILLRETRGLLPIICRGTTSIK